MCLCESAQTSAGVLSVLDNKESVCAAVWKDEVSANRRTSFDESLLKQLHLCVSACRFVCGWWDVL